MVTQTSVQDKSLIANLGEIKISNDPDTTISCLGVGSCVAVCMYDAESGVGGMAHVVLPMSDNGAKARGNATKYADIAIPELIQQLCDHGAVRARLVTKIAGGARIFSVGGAGTTFDTGARNIEAVKKVLADESIKIEAEDLGGSKGRTVRLFVDTGKLTVKTIGGAANEL